MSRAIDLLLVLIIAGLAWLLFRSTAADEETTPAERSIEAKVRVLGDAPLNGLALVILPDVGLPDALGSGARQLTPFDDNRTATIVVPAQGDYRIRFGLAPRDGEAAANDVWDSVPESARDDEQRVRITDASIVDTVELRLTPGHAAALRGLGSETSAPR